MTAQVPRLDAIGLFSTAAHYDLLQQDSTGGARDTNDGSVPQKCPSELHRLNTFKLEPVISVINYRCAIPAHVGALKTIFQVLIR